MARLKTLKPRLSVFRPKGPQPLATREEVDRRRDKRPWRRWYKTARWRSLRMQVLTRAMFTCQWPGCGRLEVDTSLLVADHRRPHRGDADLFWDEANLWCLCKPCHDGRKQAAERRADD